MSIYTLDFEIPLKEIEDKIDAMKSTGIKTGMDVSEGIKQLEENPWEVFETVFELGSLHKGTVETVNDKGAVIALPHGVEGFVPSRHTVKQDGNKLQPDDAVDFKVLDFSKESPTG